MPELETVAIHCWKDPRERWLINARDFDPKLHVAWGQWPPNVTPEFMAVPITQEVVGITAVCCFADPPEGIEVPGLNLAPVSVEELDRPEPEKPPVKAKAPARPKRKR